MRSASESFARTIAGPHLLVSRVDVLFDREVIVEGLAVDDGRVNFDRRAARLAALDLTIADPLRVPTSSADVLTPFGYELRVWRGVVLSPQRGGPLLDEDGYPLLDEFDSILYEAEYAEQTSELVALGTFPIQQSRVGAVDRITRLRALDRSQLVSDAKFLDDYVIADGTNFGTAIQDMISDGVPDLEFVFPEVSFTTPLLRFSFEDDRWIEAQRMARSFGHDLYFDGLGRCAMRAEPTFGDTPSLVIANASNLINVDVDLDRGPAYNGVVAYSANASTGDQYRATVVDDDPASPTYYYGPFGRKERAWASPFIASNAQAESAAAAVLASNLGVAKSVDFAAVPDPRLECADVVRITNSELSIDALHIVDQLSIGIGPGSALTGRSRAQEGVVSSG